MKLSIIIPVYNEEKTVTKLLKKVLEVKLPKGMKREIVVVDDGSKDSSKLKVKNAKLQYNIKELKLIEHKTNKGKGAAIRTGIKNSTGDLLIIQDADLEYDPKDYISLLEPVLSGKAEVVYGSRLKKYPLRIVGSKRTPLVLHYLGNKFLTLVTNLLYCSNLTDMETCYKLFKKSALKGIEIKSNRFEFEPEITAKLLKKGVKIYEVPISVKPRGYDEGKKITWKDGFFAVWTLVKYRFVD